MPSRFGNAKLGRPLTKALGSKKMPESSALIALYASVATCNRRCAGVENDPGQGIMGRSFYCPNGPANIDMLLVSKNPGISDPRENALYAPLDGPARVVAHEEFVRARFLGTNRIITSRYHANIVSWVSVILGVSAEHDAVFSRVAMTALVKCHSSNLKTDTLPDETKETCAGLYLYAEIQMLRPKFLLALGGEAYNYLVGPTVSSKHGLPVGKLHHPSWSNMRGGWLATLPKNFHEFESNFCVRLLPNKRVKFAGCARPTGKSEAPLPASYARR